MTTTLEPVLDEKAAAERLRAYLDGSFKYTAYRGRPPEGTPQLRTDIDTVLRAPAAVREDEAVVGKWEIDHSTDSPILTYEKCSVIQDEQAFYVLDLVRRAATPPAPSGVVGALRAQIDAEHSKVIGDDGYNYAAGQEYGLRLALIIIDKALAAIEEQAGWRLVGEIGEHEVLWDEGAYPIPRGTKLYAVSPKQETE